MDGSRAPPVFSGPSRALGSRPSSAVMAPLSNWPWWRPFALDVALVAALILLNGVFAGAEIAVISARRGLVQPGAHTGDRRATALLRLKADPDRFLATVQIGVTLVGTLAS